MIPVRTVSALLILALAAGCATSYSWKPKVPAYMRTVAVPTFRNESNVTELGAVMARQVLREFQREGTFRIASADEAALEIQGVASSVAAGVTAYDRRGGRRVHGGELTASVRISVVDKRAGKVLVDNRPYTARATYTSNGDNDTATRDASGRLAEDLARQVVDDVLNLKW